MATYASDEEQIEALKNWWDENGNSLMIGIVIVLAVFFGSRQWQSSQTETAGAASDLYQQIMDISLATQGQSINDEQFSVILSYSSALKNDFESSVYSRYSALMMAKFYVEQDELDNAATELNWILDNTDLAFGQEVDEEVFLTARLRLARVKLAQDDASAALALLGDVDPGQFSSAYAEIEGDAYIQLGQIEQARASYQQALDTNLTGNPVFLQLKLQDLGESIINL